VSVSPGPEVPAPGPEVPASRPEVPASGPTPGRPAGGLLGVTVALLLLAALLLLLAGDRTWAATVVRHPLGGVFLLAPVRVSGRSLTGVPTAAGVVALAAVAAVAATRGVGRLLLGAVLVAAGALAAVLAARHGLAPPRGLHSNGWPAVAAVGGVAEAVAGALTLRWGRRWPGMGRRYDAPAAAPARPVGLWDALERGEDPTTSPTPPGATPG
jgi:hypothetical protein